MSNGHTDVQSIIQQYEAIDEEVFGILQKRKKHVNHHGQEAMNGLLVLQKGSKD